jgi:hypothetical protein
MNQYYKKMFIFFISLLFVLSIILSCTKSFRSENADSPESDSKTEDVEKSTLVFGSDRSKTEKPAESDEIQVETTEIDKSDIKGQLFPVTSVEIIPEDTIIGPLLDFNISNTAVGSFPYAINSFFKKAEGGVLNEDVLHPTWSNSIRTLYSSELIKQEYIVRIGNIISNSGISSANIRVFSNDGRVSGDISADKLDNKWLISHISIDFRQLSDVYMRENMEFNPLSYSNILLNY